MKTAMKMTAIAVITVLMALACAPEISLTQRDWKERNESNAAKYTDKQGSPYTDDLKPNIHAALIYSSAAVAEERKEISITFPKTADILKEKNANLPDKLKKFLNFYTYDNPPSVPGSYTSSTIAENNYIGYSVIRREGTDGNIIIVKLDSIPNRARIVCKIDAANYKCSGQVVDFNGDGIGGEDYDNEYITLSIENGASGSWGYTDKFFRPEITVGINITGPEGGAFDNSAILTYISLATVVDNLYTNDEDDKIILRDIINNIEVQKYDQAANIWSKEGTVMLYNTDAPPPGLFFPESRLYVYLSLSDMGIYRVKATGMTRLSTKDSIGEKAARIIVVYTDSDNRLLNDTVYTDPVAYYTSNRQIEPNEPHFWPSFVKEVKTISDFNKKNVVLEVYFNKLPDNESLSQVHLEELQLGKFNESFKLVYRKTLPRDAFSEYPSFYENLIELPITNVKYEATKQYDEANNANNLIIITLDPNYQIDGERAINLLLSPGFKYTGGHVTFGDFSGESNGITDTYYNGTFFWANYGQLAPGFKL